VGVDADTSSAHEGERRTVVAHVHIDGLAPQDVAVQVLHGSIDSTGSFLHQPAVVSMQRQPDGAYTCTYAPSAAGPYGLTVRALPTHDGLISPVEMGIIAWAG
jgi:starch phosphorylase